MTRRRVQTLTPPWHTYWSEYSTGTVPAFRHPSATLWWVCGSPERRRMRFAVLPSRRRRLMKMPATLAMLRTDLFVGDGGGVAESRLREKDERVGERNIWEYNLWRQGRWGEARDLGRRRGIYAINSQGTWRAGV